MRKLFILMAAMLCFGAALAQESGVPDPRAAIISWAVDQYGKENGLPGGNGEISPAEQQIGDIMSDAVEEFSHSDAPLDPRAEAISGAVALYGQTEIAAYTGPDPRAEAISGAVALYGRTETVRDIRAEILSEAVALYGQENGLTNNSARDPRAEIISGAVAQYLAQSDIPADRKSMTKKRADWLIYQAIEIMVASQNLPINGYWRPLPFSMTRTGQCVAAWGDNDGPSGREGEDPGRPLCGYANEGGLPFIMWDSDAQFYLPGTSSIYSQEPSVRYESVMDSSGQMTGSIKITTTVEYEVVAPDLIIVHLFMQEEGGCTMSAEYKLELVTPDESVCAPLVSLPTPEPEPTEPPPPVEEPYRVSLALPLDEEQCNERNTPPQFSEARLHPQADGSIMIDYGTGTQQVFRMDSGSWYRYENNASNARTVISLNLSDDGTGSIFWSINSRDGNICAASLDLAQPGSEAAEPLSTPAPDGQSSGDAPAGENGTANDQPVSVAEGRYMVEWTIMDMLCPPDLQPFIPAFSEVTLSQPVPTTLTAAYAGGQFELQDLTGEQMYIFNGVDANNWIVVSSLSSDESGLVYFSWVGMPSSDSTASCVATAQLTRAD